MLGTALLLVVAGCGSTPVPTMTDPAQAPVTVPAAASPVVEDMYGPRVELPGGLLLKQPGKVAQWGGPDDADNDTFGVRLIVDRITVDPGCDSGLPAPERGHRVVITVRVETGTLFDEARDGGPHYFQWSTVGPDGITEGQPSSNQQCREAAALPFDLRPAAKYAGEITLDTANTSGRIVLSDFAAWDYPA